MNNTLPPKHPDSQTDRLLGTLTATVVMVTITGNLMSMTAIYRSLSRRKTVSKSLRKPHLLLIFCLSFLDFCIGTFHASFVSVACFMGRWLDMKEVELDEEAYPQQILNEGTWCNVSSFIIRPLLCMAIGTVAVIALERTVTISSPLRAERVLTNSRTLLLLAVFWLISLLLLVQEMYFPHVTVYILPAFQCIPSYTNTRDVTQIISTNTSYNFFNFVIITASSAYTVLTIIKLRDREKKLSLNRRSRGSACSKTRQGAYNSKRILLSITILLLISVNTGTWLPQNILSSLRYVLPANSSLANSLQDINLRVIVWWLQYMSSAVNPVIYALRLRVMREEIRIVWQMVLRKIRSIDLLDSAVTWTSFMDKTSFNPLGRI